jgi:hypothetical protein
MDLLGYLRQETGNEKTACRKSALGAERGNATAVLLAWLSASPAQREKMVCTAILSASLIDGRNDCPAENGHPGRADCL